MSRRGPDVLYSRWSLPVMGNRRRHDTHAASGRYQPIGLSCFVTKAAPSSWHLYATLLARASACAGKAGRLCSHSDSPGVLVPNHKTFRRERQGWPGSGSIDLSSLVPFSGGDADTCMGCLCCSASPSMLSDAQFPPPD